MPAVHACLTRQRLQAPLSPCNWPDRSPNPSHTQPRPHAHIRRHMHAPTPPKTSPYLLQLPWSRACALPSARAAAPWVPAWWLRSSSEARPFNQLAGAQAERGHEAEPATPAPPPCPCRLPRLLPAMAALAPSPSCALLSPARGLSFRRRLCAGRPAQEAPQRPQRHGQGAPRVPDLPRSRLCQLLLVSGDFAASFSRHPPVLLPCSFPACLCSERTAAATRFWRLNCWRLPCLFVAI